jgi:hypothetical protein
LLRTILNFKKIFRRAVFGIPVAGVLMLALNAAASAGFDPYPSGLIGYDYSYPQCGAAAPSAGFGIVGANAGYPFTYYNTCLAAEFAAASRTGNAAVYINTGYDPSYTAVDGRHSTQDCVNKDVAITGTQAQRAAWAVGCSEAQRDTAYASSQSAAAINAWWLDIEVANSWSTTDLSLNRYTIQGIIDTLRLATAVPIGIYSTSSMWSQIAGAFRPAVDANWLATGQRTLKRARQSCGAAGFTGAKIWLVQYVPSTDRDYVC